MIGFKGQLLRGQEWRDRSYAGMSVAVIAPGREAAAIVPIVVRTAVSVKVFQEEADWLLPFPVPGPSMVAVPLARINLRLQVRDPWTRRRLTPNARLDRRPPSAERHYYSALRQPHCKLISWPAYALVRDGIRSAEGIEHHVDCIILGEAAANLKDLCK